MIDDIFQAGTDQAIRDRLQRPVVGPVQQPGAFANFWQVYKSPAASVLDLTAAKADETYGFGQVLAAGGTDSGGGMFSLQSPAEKAQSDAAHDKLMRQGVDMNSPEGDALRVKAREFMPDPATSGTATRVVAGLLNFAPQAAAAATAGPGGIIDLGVNTGLNESDALRQQGVDFATRSKAGTVAGAAAAASMLLPMSGASAGVRFLKGAAGGEVSMAGQAELEHLILQHAGYDKQAAAYDPLDPVTLALGVVPGVLGAALGHGGPVPVRTPEQMRAAVDFTPAEQAHSDAIEGSAANLRQLDEAIATTKDPAALADLKKLRDQAQALHDAARAAATDLNVEAAVRVRQTAAAIDESRLTPDTDVAGIDQHQQAVEMASDQLARGVPVDVSPAFGDTMLDSMRESRVTEDRIDFLEAHRAQLLGDAGNLLGPGDVADLRRQVADLQSQLVDAGPAAVKARAQELQGKNVSYKQASARAQRELAGQLADQQAQIQRLQDQLQQHARAAQATERLSFVERDLAAARERGASLPGPRTAPRRLALALANAFAELRREPAAPAAGEAIPARAQAFHDARTAASKGSAGGDPAPVEFDRGFTTAKGSTYVLHEDGTTTRNKAARSDPGHEGDSGVKERSARTVYLDESPPSAAGLSNVSNPRIAVKDGRLSLVSKNADGKWGAAASQRGIAFHEQPAVGRYPLELWQPRSDVPGHEAYAGMHAGNAITEIRGGAKVSGEKVVASTAPGPATPAADRPPSPAADQVSAAVSRLELENPDLLVQLDGMDQPVRLADLMASVREDAARDTRDAPLLEVAAQCALSLPALR